MRKSGLATKIISAVIVIAVVAYMAVYIVSALGNPLETAEAVLATAEDTIPISGYFARDEQRVYSAMSGAASPLKGEGEKVSKGESLVVSYSTSEAKTLHERIDELDRRIAELEAATAETSVGDINRLDTDLEAALDALAYSAASGALDSAIDYADELGLLLLRRDYSSGRYGEDAFSETLDELYNEKTALESRASGTEVALYAPTSGYFSSAADGYENILTMDSVLDMAPSDVRALDTAAEAVEANCAGKLITSFGWRFVSVMSEADAAFLGEGKWVTARFTGDYVGSLRIRVYSVSEPENGEVAVVFSCATEIGALAGLRHQTAELVINEFEGVRVPKDAVRVDENGSAGVYTMVAMQANFVRIDLETAYETENYYIVSYDPSSSSSIRPGDEIIVRSKNLYDGKVLQ